MKVAVVMSTYNGEQYLDEQVNSILQQTGVEVELFIRDDGSSDSTQEKLSAIASKYHNVHFINSDHVENLGIRDSFFSVLQYAYNQAEIPYFAFSDQDDFWLPEKLSCAIKMIEAQPDNPRGRLYYSNKTFVDKELNVISEENIPIYNDCLEIFWKNRASGCVMVMDRNLTHYILRKWPKTNCIHDGRIYRVAKSIGSTIVFDKNSYIYYRQHETNSVGIKGSSQYNSKISYWAKRFLPMIFEKRHHNLIQFMGEIKQDYDNEITADAKKSIEALLKYRKSLVAKFQLLFDHRMKKRPVKDRLIWAYRILFNWLP